MTNSIRSVHRARPDMAFGLVTWLWGQDWELPTLLRNCREAGVQGVELRTTHAHGVERTLNREEREEVQRRFADSGVVLVGIGSNERFDSPDPAALEAAKEATRAFVRLSHDVGGTGVKVKPDSFHAGVPRERTIAQIAAALAEMAEYGAGFGQQIRLEAHGQCAPPPILHEILTAADHPNARLCWNCNAADLEGEGLENHFRLLRPWLGDTVHIRQFGHRDYPTPKFLEMLAHSDYAGWILLEDSRPPDDRVAGLRQEREAFQQLMERIALAGER